jgi:putative spermidine/putrescine transport system ATP-binding protein
MASSGGIEKGGTHERGSLAIVSLRNLSKTYGQGPTVLDDVSLDVRRGEFLTLLGPSGSGKTTTLMLIAGFHYPTRGSVHIEDRDVTSLAAYRRNIGVVFQSYALFPHMSVAQNIAFPLELRKVNSAERERRVGEALDLVHLGGLGARRPAELSGGQQQRVALARALVYRPNIVLMDEPLGALDRSLRESMQREFREIHRSLGVTFIYVTHDQEEALTMSDRIAVFHKGRMVQIGSPDEVYHRPKSQFVAKFLGEANLFEGRVEAFEGPSAIVRLPGGERLHAPRSTTTAIGDDVCVVVRPEAARLGPIGPNALEGALTDVAFHGDHLRLRLALAGGKTFVVKVAAQGVTLPSLGETLTIGVPDTNPTILLSNHEKGE